jgi:hypothetical protein
MLVPIPNSGLVFSMTLVVGLYYPGPGFRVPSFIAKSILKRPPIDFDGPSAPMIGFSSYYPGPGTPGLINDESRVDFLKDSYEVCDLCLSDKVLSRSAVPNPYLGAEFLEIRFTTVGS